MPAMHPRDKRLATRPLLKSPTGDRRSPKRWRIVGIQLNNHGPALRDQSVAVAVAHNARKAGHVQVAARDEQPLRRHEIEDAPSIFCGQRLVDVEFAGHLRTRHLNLGHVHGIAPNHQGLASRVQTITGMTGRMAGELQQT